MTNPEPPPPSLEGVKAAIHDYLLDGGDRAALTSLFRELLPAFDAATLGDIEELLDQQRDEESDGGPEEPV